MKLSDFHYELPLHLIAQEPPSRREDARLMLLERTAETIQHLRFPQILDFLNPGEVIVLNDTRVLPARLFGKRATGGKVEALLVGPAESGYWHVLLHARGKLKPGEVLAFEQGQLPAALVQRHPQEGWIVRFDPPQEELLEKIHRLGRMPLPPYIKRKGESDPRWEQDRVRYQTVFARQPGAIAAPTAGLHFTEPLLEEARQRRLETVTITLHVGLGTFKPVIEQDPTRHRMHPEYYAVSQGAAQAINAARQARRRVLAVGTTTCRTLEASAREGLVHAGSGWTSLFIYPPFKFQIVDALLTNFHLPQSTLLMLVSAFAGRELILRAYQAAIREGYRFYSYGDAMLIL